MSKNLSFGQSGAESGIVSKTITTLKNAFMPTVAPQIVDTVNTANYGILGLPQRALQSIYKNSGPLADAAEFQVDYWALNFRTILEDNSHLDVAVPLVFFNYPQEVSGARIDFEMKDIDETSTKLLPIAQLRANEVLSTDFKKNLEEFFNLSFEPMLVPLNTIHKHPGTSASQSFSGTDLTKTVDPHGVVFPWNKPDEPNMPNFASIMALDGRINNLAHSEYRIVNGELGKDICYQQGRCLSFTIEELQLSTVERLLNPAINKELTVRYKESKASIDTSIKQSIVVIYNDLYRTFTPATDFVFAENLTKKPTSYATSYWDGSGYYTKKERKKKKKAEKKQSRPILEELGYTYLQLQNIDAFHLSFLLELMNKLAIKRGDIYTKAELDLMTKEEVITNIKTYVSYLDATLSKVAPEIDDPNQSDFYCFTRSELAEFTRFELLTELSAAATEAKRTDLEATKWSKSTLEITELIMQCYDIIAKQEAEPIKPSSDIVNLFAHTADSLKIQNRPYLYTVLEKLTLANDKHYYPASAWSKTLDELVAAILNEMAECKETLTSIETASKALIEESAKETSDVMIKQYSMETLIATPSVALAEILRQLDCITSVTRTNEFYETGHHHFITTYILKAYLEIFKKLDDRQGLITLILKEPSTIYTEDYFNELSDAELVTHYNFHIKA